MKVLIFIEIGQFAPPPIQLIVIYDSEVKKRNVGKIKDCDIEIVDLFNLRN